MFKLLIDWIEMIRPSILVLQQVCLSFPQYIIKKIFLMPGTLEQKNCKPLEFFLFVVIDDYNFDLM